MKKKTNKYMLLFMTGCFIVAFANFVGKSLA